MPTDFGPEDGNYTDNTEYLIDTLPSFMENDEKSNNWKLYTPIGNRFSEIESQLAATDRATEVQNADTIDQLKKLAELVDLDHRGGETKEHYRSRIFARYQVNTAEATVPDILHSVSTILDTDIRNIDYLDGPNAAQVNIIMPAAALESLNLGNEEVAEILSDLVPAGYEVNGLTKGTFKYVSPSTYNETSNWSQYDGYNGLDTNGDPKDGGGTYAGIIN